MLHAFACGEEGTAITAFPEKNPLRPERAGSRPYGAPVGDRERPDRLPANARGDRPDLELGFLYGPRGDGKTALLRWLRAETSAAHVAPVALVLGNLNSSDGLTRAFRAATRRFSNLAERIMRVEADVGGIRIGVAGGDSIPLLAYLLDQGDDTFFLTLDQAHEAPPVMLGRFLNAAQLAGENRPVAVAFAGTPGLEAVMRAARVVLEAGKTLHIGPLDGDGVRRAGATVPGCRTGGRRRGGCGSGGCGRQLSVFSPALRVGGVADGGDVG